MNTAPYHERLTAMLAEIEAELSTIGTYDPETDNWEAVPDASELTEADENSEADAVESWNERRATLATLEQQYRNIKRALKKIDDGSYGRCEISGEAIEPERLDVLPTARTCIAHKDDEATLPV